ncbi:hypothetical protein V5O48_014702 [Marasmius crinis-equi]|uniref:laccase n=1 Tax=Marasmius crinis-equi TaxID=585013 RepID=A0ABR3EWK2_9AGAR
MVSSSFSRFLFLGVLVKGLYAASKRDLPAPSFSFTHSSSSIGPLGELRVSNGVVAPDGFSRDAVLVNGITPGPVITATKVGSCLSTISNVQLITVDCCKGETLSINVIDELTNSSTYKSTSIHWHGLFQRGYAWADGTQYCDGLRGPIVIYDPRDPHAGLYDVDDESTIITLSDWYRTPAYSGLLNWENDLRCNIDKRTGYVQVPANRGLVLYPFLSGRYQGGPATALAVINVDAGKRYRFRLVSISCDPPFIFSIDGHPLTIIEVDGTNHEPLEVNSLEIFAGQRYSVVLDASMPVANYWIRANPSTPAGRPGFTGGINQAILRYRGAPTTEPSVDSQLPLKSLNEIDLHPLRSYGDIDMVPGEPRVDGADVNLNLAIDFDTSASRYRVNGVPFVAPTVPVLLQILSGAKSAESLLPRGSVYSLPLNKTIQISMPLTDNMDAPHPMHLHGHNFHVVRSAGSSEYNFDNPPIRDVVSIGASTSDNVTIRFRTDNSGPWFLHCHIEQHLGAGLAVVLAEGVSDVAAANPVPEDWKQLCPIYDEAKSDDRPLLA